MPAPIVQAHSGGIGPTSLQGVNETNLSKLNEESPRRADEMQGEQHHQEMNKERRGDPLEEQEGGEEDQQHQEQPHPLGGGEEISCAISMQIRMPGPKVQASQGGLSPITSPKTLDSNPSIFKRLKSPKLKWIEKERIEEGLAEGGNLQGDEEAEMKMRSKLGWQRPVELMKTERCTGDS